MASDVLECVECLSELIYRQIDICYCATEADRLSAFETFYHVMKDWFRFALMGTLQANLSIARQLADNNAGPGMPDWYTHWATYFWR